MHIGGGAVHIAELGLSKLQMGMIYGMFALAYGLFEIPMGWYGDRVGQRRVLTRIVWGAMLLPLLALTLLIMNNRTAWVGDRLRASLPLNLVLAAALGFFAFTAMREVMRLAG